MPVPDSILLRLLGGPSVRTVAGREAAAVLAQPKRLALLAYLAAASPHGFHRRDTLLALLWPDADQNHARTALRKALHFLRHELGPDAIASRGDEELGLGPSVRCDVRELDAHLAAGRLLDALALYRGDLLPGFYVADAPEFEHWLEEERMRLRERAVEAAWTTAARLEREGAADGAARWARWAAGFAPDDERAARRLIALLGRLGDRGGALRVYEEVAARLKREYEVAPSAETQELVDAIRSGRPIPGLPTPAPAPASAAPARAPPAGRAGHEDTAAPHVTSREYIAIFPFHVHGDGSAGYLREGLVDLLSTNLDHAGTLHSIDPQALLSLIGRQEGERRLDPQHAGELADRFGAGQYVLGTVVAVGGQLRITAALHDRPAGAASARFITVAGPADRLFDLVDDLAAKLLAELHPGPGARLSRLAATTTASLPALKAYLAGERAFRAVRHQEAVEAFQRAVEHDPDFALAWYRLAFFIAWPTLPQPTSPETVIAQALRHRHRLSERDRLLLEALSASIAGAAGEAERLYRQILAIHPEDVEAWLCLGQTLVFHNQQRGRLITESRTAFERVLELDPGNQIANLFLSYVAGLEGNAEESDRRTGSSPAQSDFPHPWIVKAFRRGDREEQERFLTLLRGAADGVVYDAVRFVATLTLDFPAARRVARLLADPGRSTEVHGIHHVLAAFLDLAAGRWQAASRRLLEAAPLLPSRALEYRGLAAAMPFLPVEPHHLEALRSTLAGWDAGAVPRSAHPHPAFSLHHPAYPVLRLYLLGVIAARLGDDAALDRAAELDAATGDSDVEALARDLARSVRARVAAMRGDPAAALERLEGARMEARCMLNVLQSPFYAQTAERWLRAELLEELGRYDEAIRWYESLAQSSLYDLVYLAPSHLRRARILDRLGRHDRAAEHYRRFIALWCDSDPGLQPLVAEATARVGRLGWPPGAVPPAAALHQP